MVQKYVLLLLSMDNIHYNFIDVEIPEFNPEFFDLWMSKLFDHYNIKVKEISFIMCSDEHLKEMNIKYLEHDYYTDVLTFNYNDKDSLIGDVFVSFDRVKENSINFGNDNWFDELCRVMAHGLLHLTGFDDKTEESKKEMLIQEELCLNLR